MPKVLCNYHFVAECHDLNKTEEAQKKGLSESKCSGLSKQDSEAGGACDAWSRSMMNK